MSVVFDVRERVTVKDAHLLRPVINPEPGECEDSTVGLDTVNEMIYRFSLLGALYLQDDARYISISATIDGQKYTVRINDEDGGLDALHKLISAMNDADNVDIDAYYTVTWRSSSFFANCLMALGLNEENESTQSAPMSFSLADYIMSFGLGTVYESMQPEEMEGIYYNYWFKSDSNESCGTVRTYGEKDGVFYTGKVEPKPVDKLPDGEWMGEPYMVYGFTEDYIYDDVDTEESLEEVYDKLEPLCRELVKFDSCPENYKNGVLGAYFSSDGCGFELNYYDPLFTNSLELETAIGLMDQMDALLERDRVRSFDLIQNGKEISIAHITAGKDGKYTITIESY